MVKCIDLACEEGRSLAVKRLRKTSFENFLKNGTPSPVKLGKYSVFRAGDFYCLCDDKHVLCFDDLDDLDYAVRNFVEFEELEEIPSAIFVPYWKTRGFKKSLLINSDVSTYFPDVNECPSHALINLYKNTFPLASFSALSMAHGVEMLDLIELLANGVVELVDYVRDPKNRRFGAALFQYKFGKNIVNYLLYDCSVFQLKNVVMSVATAFDDINPFNDRKAKQVRQWFFVPVKTPKSANCLRFRSINSIHLLDAQELEHEIFCDELRVEDGNMYSLNPMVHDIDLSGWHMVALANAKSVTVVDEWSNL